MEQARAVVRLRVSSASERGRRRRVRSVSVYGGFGPSTFSRRKLVSGAAAGVAAATVCSNRLTALAQDATPVAGEAAACAEPFDAGRLSTVKMVTDGSPITVAIVPKGVHPFF